MEQPKTLYLIDDDTDDLDFFREAAAKIDPLIICVTSSDSVSALAAFKNYDVPVPDIIFLDLNMPSIDGRKFLVELKKLKAYSQTPVIILSTSNHSKDKEETKSMGASGFLTKPCSQIELIKELKRILESYVIQIPVWK